MSQPLDTNSFPIPALRLRANGAHRLDVTVVSTRTSVPFASHVRVISVFATAPVFVRTGDASVVASLSDHYLPEATYLDLSLGDDLSVSGRHSFLAAVEAETDCTLYISERE